MENHRYDMNLMVISDVDFEELLENAEIGDKFTSIIEDINLGNATFRLSINIIKESEDSARTDYVLKIMTQHEETAQICFEFSNELETFEKYVMLRKGERTRIYTDSSYENMSGYGAIDCTVIRNADTHERRNGIIRIIGLYAISIVSHFQIL